MRLVTMPGIGGSDEDHWQTLWEREGDITRFRPSSWDAPVYSDWIAALERSAADDTVLIVAHSLSCLLAVRWAGAHPERVAGLFLVAPPDPEGPRFPRQGHPFGADLDVQPPVPALLVTSDTDPYCTPERAQFFADVWRIPLVSVGRRGHLNSSSHLGDWQEGRNLLTAFTAGLHRRNPR